MNGLGGCWRPAAITLALAALFMAGALTVAACGGGSAETAGPQASSGTGGFQPVERHGRLGDTIVLADGSNGRVEVTAIGMKFMATVATRDSTVSNVYCVKVKLHNVGAARIHLAAVGANSVLFDAGGWRYFSPGNNPRNALDEVALGPGDTRVGWVYFAAPAEGGAPKELGAPDDFQYTVKSSGATAAGDTGQWKWSPTMPTL